MLGSRGWTEGSKCWSMPSCPLPFNCHLWGGDGEKTLFSGPGQEHPFHTQLASFSDSKSPCIPGARHPRSPHNPASGVDWTLETSKPVRTARASSRELHARPWQDAHFPTGLCNIVARSLRRITVQTTQQPLCYLNVTSLRGVINSPELNRSVCKLNSVGPEDCHYLNYIPEFSIHLLPGAAGPVWIRLWTVMDAQSWSQQLAMFPSWLSLQEALGSLKTLPLLFLLQSPR